MKYLVAGGGGFIGSHLCEELLKEDNEVICIDNFCTSSEANIRHLKRKKNFSLIKKDILEVNGVEGEIDKIFHLASRASLNVIRPEPIHTLRTNSQGTYNLLKIAQEKNSQFIFASTSEVYGDPKEHPQKEEYRGNVNTTGPRSCYDEAKRYGESLVHSYGEKNNVDIRIARIFNTYGPRMRLEDGRVVINFIKQALREEELTIHGKGEQTRSFCYVNDMVSGLKSLSDSHEQRPVNLGVPNEVTINTLADKINELTGNTGKKHVERPKDDPERRKPDISRAKNQLNWRPKTSLDEGLRKTIKDVRSREEL